MGRCWPSFGELLLGVFVGQSDMPLDTVRAHCSRIAEFTTLQGPFLTERWLLRFDPGWVQEWSVGNCLTN